MALFTVESLIVAITSDELFELALSGLETIGIPARSWRRGSVARSLLAVMCELGAQGAAVIAAVVAGMFLLFARGVYLTAHAKDVYDVDRPPATFATGTIQLTNTGGFVFTIGANETVVRSSVTGARYRVTAAYVLPGNTTITVPVSAIESGSASSVGPGDLDTLETPLNRVTCTNPAALVGDDELPDDKLVELCKLKRATWSPFGPRDAYEYAALTAKLLDGSATGINRVSVSRYSSTSEVLVVCATSSGVPSVAALEAVRLECERIARPDTVKMTVSGAIPRATANTITIWARGGTATLIEQRAGLELSKLIASWPIGGIAKTDGGQGYLYTDAMAASVIKANTETFDVDVSGADIALAPNEVATNTTTFVVNIR